MSVLCQFLYCFAVIKEYLKILTCLKYKYFPPQFFIRTFSPEFLFMTDLSGKGRWERPKFPFGYIIILIKCSKKE